MAEETDLDEVWVLCRDVLENGAPLALNGEMRTLLLRTAQQVAISARDAEEALRGLPTATTLLRELHQRIGEGARRLNRAQDRVEELQEKGDLDGARQLIRDVLAVEVVPRFRQAAEEQLRGLDSPPSES